MAKVTVITPTYQHARFIEACLASVIAQTEPDWEMVVVDDGSTDGTAEIVGRFDDPRIHLIRRPHEGLAGLGSLYNLALRESAAPCIAILEGDDTWPSDKLARQLPSFDDPAVVLAYGPAELIDAADRVFATYSRRPAGATGCNEPMGAILPALAQGNFIVAPTVIVRRTALERIDGFWQPSGVPFVDHPTWLRLALEGRFAVADRPVGRWRRHIRQYTTSAVIESPHHPVDYLDVVMALAAERGLTVPHPGPPDPQSARARTLIGEARLALLARDGARARRILGDVVRRSPTAPRRGIALVGILASFVGGDLEWLFRRAGRLSWPRDLFDEGR